MKMNLKNLPIVSVLIPTLNSGSVLEECLKSIVKQDYPQKRIEMIIADGGSTDKTLAIAKKYGAKIRKNPLKTGEAGKAVALRQAKGDLVALIDSDNILPTKNWLKRMVEPFSDKEVIGSEPWQYTYREKDGFIDRYCALTGVNDPYCLFVGNYDRLSVLSGRWTGLAVEQEDKGQWIKATLKADTLPTIGANGTIMRQQVLTKSKVVGDYLVDIDVMADLAKKEPVKFAKVKIGIIHLFCGQDLGKFIRKQKRRVKDYHYYQKKGERAYNWQEENQKGVFKFILACVTMAPLFYQAIKGYLKEPDLAWFFHPLACWLTLVIYGWETILSRFTTAEMSRKKYGQ